MIKHYEIVLNWGDEYNNTPKSEQADSGIKVMAELMLELADGCLFGTGTMLMGDDDEISAPYSWNISVKGDQT